MTFDSRFCEDLFDTLGRDDALRHAYRVYLWRRALELVYHPPLDHGVIAGVDLCPDIKHPFPSTDRLNGLDVERALRM